MSREIKTDRRRRLARSFRPLVEELESRLAPTVAVTNFHVHPLAIGSSPSGFTPLQILEAYGFYSTSGTNNISFNGAAGNGAGQTIAIVDAYHDPYIYSDLVKFDTQFNLPSPGTTTFTLSVLNQNGTVLSTNGTNTTAKTPAADPSGGWEMEEALDVEWAHAIAPGANIVLVEASSDYTSDLNTAVTTAAKLSGVSAVSMSWSGSELRSETSQDSVFTTPSGHQGVTFLAATGDSGTPAGYPAYSPNVVAVGGTSLYINSNNNSYSYNYETAWNNSIGAGGGGTSSYEVEPAYQKSVQSTGYRTVPDVSLDADPNTGVPIYDSYLNSSGPWTQIGGTSLSTPMWAGIIAIINQGRVATGGTTLNGATQTLPGLYSLPSSDFHDITLGSNGTYSAKKGYDEATGLGTPVAGTLISDMVAYANAAVPHLVVTSAPQSSVLGQTAVTAGSPFNFSATVYNNDGTIDTSFSGNVTVSLLSNPGGSTLTGGPFTVSVIDSSGVATFSGLLLNKTGIGYTLAVSGANLNGTATSGFNVVAGQATQIVVWTQPPPSVGQTGTFSVAFAVEDSSGNIATTYSGSMSVSLNTNSSGGTLSGTTTATVTSGLATFSSLIISQPGTYSLQAVSGSFTSGPTNTFAVTSTPTQLGFIVSPASSVTEGSPFSVTVVAEDSSGNPVSTFTGKVTVSFSTNPVGGTLGGTTAVNAVGGQATFPNLTINKPGNGYVLQFSATGLIPTTAALNVAVAASRLVITPPLPEQLRCRSAYRLHGCRRGQCRQHCHHLLGQCDRIAVHQHRRRHPRRKSDASGKQWHGPIHWAFNQFVRHLFAVGR